MSAVGDARKRRQEPDDAAAGAEAQIRVQELTVERDRLYREAKTNHAAALSARAKRDAARAEVDELAAQVQTLKADRNVYKANLKHAQRQRDKARAEADELRELLDESTETIKAGIRSHADLTRELAAANARNTKLESELPNVCKCEEGDACSNPNCLSNLGQATDEQRARRLSEIYDTGAVQVPQGTFNQCEVHGKCVDENWNDDAGVSHASCLGPVPERILTRLREMERDEAQAERDALQARLDAVTELLPIWEKLHGTNFACPACTFVKELRTALDGPSDD